jgi:hypothetical protein
VNKEANDGKDIVVVVKRSNQQSEWLVIVVKEEFVACWCE